jgi:hypothetical protein
MTKDDIIALSVANGETKPTVDFAIPQPWADMVREHQIESRDFVWSYGGSKDEPKNMFGQPVHIGTYLLRAVQKGNLIPSDILENIVEMARNGKSVDEIKELVKLHCENL